MKDEWAQDGFRPKAQPEGWGLTGGHSGVYVIIDCFTVIKVIFQGFLLKKCSVFSDQVFSLDAGGC